MSDDTRRETPRLTDAITQDIWKRIHEHLPSMQPNLIIGTDHEGVFMVITAGWMWGGEAPLVMFYRGVINWHNVFISVPDIERASRLIAAGQAKLIADNLDLFLEGGLTSDDVSDIGTLPSDTGRAVRWSPDTPAIDETPTIELGTDDTQPLWWNAQLDAGHGDMDEHAPEAFEMFVRALRMGGLGR